MAITGAYSSYQNTNSGSADSSMDQRVCYIAEHDTVSGVTLIDASTDIKSIFGEDHNLTNELEILQANADARLVAYVYTAQSITSSNIQEVLDEVKSQPHEFTCILIDVDADEDFANKVILKRESFATQQSYKSFILRYKYANSYSLEGLSVINESGIASIEVEGNEFEVGDEIIIVNSTNYSTAQIASKSGDTITLDTTYTEETFSEKSTIEISPSSYCTQAATTFENLSSSFVGIIAPTTQRGYMGACAGLLSKTQVQIAFYKYNSCALKGVSLNYNYRYSHYVALDSGRIIFPKHFEQDKSQIFFNDCNILYSPTADIKNFYQARVICKALRQSELYSLQILGNQTYTRDDEGAKIAGIQVSRAFDEMINASPLSEIADYTVETKWTGEKSLQNTFTITDVNNTKTVINQIQIVGAA